ncbi:MAG: hypothetical protein H0U70_06865 [Tatlockia sp.]|nr:hypothetical protein [Tatlockia sp.]
MTPTEHLYKLVETPQARAKFLHELAYALRQEAVTEICSNLEKYRGAFVDEHEGTSLEEMRKPTTYIDEVAMHALSVVTQVPIAVHVVESSQDIPLRLAYNSHYAASPIVLKLQGKHYVPRVSQPEFFEAVVNQKIGALRPKVNKAFNDPAPKDIFAKIEKEDRRLQDEYERTSKRLFKMVELGELTLDKLVDIYVKNMGSSDYLQGRVKQVGIEHGNQYFFEKIQAAQQGLRSNSPISDNFYLDELVHAIARALTLEQLDPQQVYEAEEKASLRI